MQMISGNVVDVMHSRIYPGTLMIEGGKIVDVIEGDGDYETYITPGFIDSHCHVESSMMTPAEFARAAAVHGTVGVVSDPHEIANVLGVDGIKYMIENSGGSPVRFYYGAPPCVPATFFETSGAVIDPGEIEQLMASREIRYLAEVMNFPGVINGDPDIHAKLNVARKYGKPMDGHAPGLRGKELEKYVSAGISTDHECFQREEAMEKIRLGMKIMLREGSAARNFDELVPLLESHHERVMLCTDDKHPDDLLKGHINDLARRAVQFGIEPMKILRAACVNPVMHYGMDIGLLQRGDRADFVVLEDIRDFRVLKTYIGGEVVAENGSSRISRDRARVANKFVIGPKRVEDFMFPPVGGDINVIVAEDGQLMTDRIVTRPKIEEGRAVSDPRRDILKIAVINRYAESRPSVAFIKNFGLRSGAIASSVAHDSHNIVAVGVADRDICRAVNLVIKEKGGISAVNRNEEKVLPLPIAGLMSDGDCSRVAAQYSELNGVARALGSSLHAPFMTLSFMALLVIPRIKLSDKGLFDGDRFQYMPLFERES